MPADAVDRETRILGIIETARAKRPKFRDERITMAHGAGGKATGSLIEGLLLPAFASRELEPLDLDDAGVAERVERRRGERGEEQSLDEARCRLSPGAVRHRDVVVTELRALAPRGLDDPEDLLLAVRDGLGHPHTTSRSRAKRP